ncbi:hypothetical protein ACFY36_02690 [Actinoplanes sp. NPDC000266]
MTEAPHPQPWELGKRYMEGELDPADFLDQSGRGQSSRDLPVRVTQARTIAAIIGIFVTVSYAVLAVYLWDGDKILPSLFSIGGALGVAIISVTRYLRRD